MVIQRLPPGVTTPSTAPAATAAPERWSAEDLARWLAAPGLAPWVPALIEGLRVRFHDDLPALFGQGLGARPASATGVPAWCRPSRPRPDWLQRFLIATDGDTARLWFAQGFLRDDPPWLETLLQLDGDRVARSFLLTGNIADYAFDPGYGYRLATRLLIERLLEHKDCVLTFRLSRGLVPYSRDLGGRLSTAAETAAVRALPRDIQAELGQPFQPGQRPLLADICRRFDLLSRVLSGQAAPPAASHEGVERLGAIAILFENLNLIIPPDANDIDRNYLVDALLHWSSGSDLEQGGHCVVMMAEALDDIGNELRTRGGRIEQLEIPRPGAMEARLKFLLPILDPTVPMSQTRLHGNIGGLCDLVGYEGPFARKREKLARDTAGMTLIGIEDLLQQAVRSERRSLDRERVMVLKRERLRQESEGLLEVVDPRRTLADIGGYEPIKARLRSVIEALRNPDDALLRDTCPMGILFLGPPGTGKSIMAEAIAGESRISMARLGDFRGMYVGQSERNLTRILGLIESLHPVIVFIDEIDQALGKRSSSAEGDGGVDRRIFGRFLEFMSDTRHRGQILWVGASNRADKIDAAMKRPGRFDLALPFLLPDLEARGSILATLLARQTRNGGLLEVRLSDADRERIAVATDGFSGAELELLVNEAVYRAAHARGARSGPVGIDAAGFAAVLEDYQPPPKRREDYEEMTKHAIDAISFVNLLPEPYRGQRLLARAGCDPSPASSVGEP